MRDVNLELASVLYDMAAIAGDSQRAFGYKRAAKAVLRIDRDITPLVTAKHIQGDRGNWSDDRSHRARAHRSTAAARLSNVRSGSPARRRRLPACMACVACI
jgi:hypothetical protein